MGIFPQWIPYEAIGYPLAINSQSGLYYPIFWLFPLLHTPYTLHAAVIVQVFHVLLGSIGMFLLLNLIFKSSRYAFIGAVAFQFFGGFYSNAEHPDIIRAFAIAPWLFYVIKLNINKPRITRRILFIPIVIYFLATGGYPGNFISSLFIIPVFLSLEIFYAYLKVKRRALKVGAATFGLMVLGISMSVIHLGPPLQGRNELTRFTNYVSQVHVGLGKEDIPASYMSSRPIPGEPSMTSTFVTLPMLIFASFIPVSAIKKQWVFVVILILSILMVGGPYSPFWRAISSVVPSLDLSRFPSSDYRVFVAIPLIILGTAGLRAIIECKLSWKELIFRAAFVSTWFLLGIYSLYSNPYTYTLYANVRTHSNFFVINSSQVFVNFEVTAAVFILSAALLFITYYVKTNKMLQRFSSFNKPIVLSSSAFIIIILLISSDGFRVISDMQTWKEKPVDALYVNNKVPLEKNGKLITFSIFENIPNERPARESSDPHKDPNNQHFTWNGYLQGKYMMQDKTNTILQARAIVESNNIFKQYMLMKWTPILVEPFAKSNNSPINISLPMSTFSNITELHHASQDSTRVNQVLQTKYGINDISYNVTLKEPRLMVENEIFFPGWQADLIFQHKEMNLQASVVNDVFRAWLLPAGDYIMIAHFHYPNLIIYQGITIVSFGIWIFIIGWYWRRLDGDSEQQIKSGRIVPPS